IITYHTNLSDYPILPIITIFSFFFFNNPTPTEIYTLSLHDALPISDPANLQQSDWSTGDSLPGSLRGGSRKLGSRHFDLGWWKRSEEHTSELQSRGHLVCRLLLEKKKSSGLEDRYGIWASASGIHLT